MAAEIQRLGIPLEGHLAAAGIPDEALEVTDLVIPEKPVWALLGLVRQREGVEDLGFRIGASHHVTEIAGLSGPLSGHPTLIETLWAFCTRVSGHNNAWNFWIERTSDGVRICRYPAPISTGEWPMEQYAISYLVDLVRMAASDSWWPREIWLHTEPRLTAAESRWLQDAQLHFGGPVTAIRVPDPLLGKAVRLPPPTGGSELQEDALDEDLVPTLRRVLRAYLPAQRTRMREICDIVDLHPRTLQRRLREVETSYQRVLDQARFELARDRLEGDQPISEISSDLGFRHPSVFSRTFRRWARISPTEYRRANRVDPWNRSEKK